MWLGHTSEIPLLNTLRSLTDDVQDPSRPQPTVVVTHGVLHAESKVFLQRTRELPGVDGKAELFRTETVSPRGRRNLLRSGS